MVLFIYNLRNLAYWDSRIVLSWTMNNCLRSNLRWSKEMRLF